MRTYIEHSPSVCHEAYQSHDSLEARNPYSTPSAQVYQTVHSQKSKLPKQETKKTILLLENETEVSCRIQLYLHPMGFKVLVENNPGQLFQRLRQCPQDISIIMVSAEMLRETLILFVENVSRFSRYYGIPLILLSSGKHLRLVEECLAKGADDYIAKPIQSLECRTRCKNVLNRYQLKQAFTQQRVKIQEELSTARKLQMSLLPQSPIQHPGITFTWYYKPQGELGGDMLNVFTLAEDLYGLYVADVCGHGPATAMMSIWLGHTLHPPPNQEVGEVGKTSEAIHTMLLRPKYTCRFLEKKLADMKHSFYLTLIYVLFDLQGSRMIYSRCGHPFPILQSDNEPCRLLQEGGGPAIGMDLGLSFSEHVQPLQSNDRIFFYSDGLLEARSPKGEAFGIQRCLMTLELTRHLSLDQQIEALVKEVSRFQQQDAFEDDITIVGAALT